MTMREKLPGTFCAVVSPELSEVDELMRHVPRERLHNFLLSSVNTRRGNAAIN